MSKKLLVGVVGAVVVFLIAGYFGWKNRPEPVLGLESTEFTNYATDVIGTKTGSSTVGFAFGNDTTGKQSATSSYVNKIHRSINEVIYTHKVTSASTTSNLTFSFLGSNDDYCDTTSTIPYISVLKSEINWFDIADHLRNKVHATSLPNVTTTYSWATPKAGLGEVVILTDMNYECVRLDVSGNSTTLWTQIKTK